MRQIRRMLLDRHSCAYECSVRPIKVAEILAFPDSTSPLREKDAAFLPVLFAGPW
jgi:hypothetical protein